VAEKGADEHRASARRGPARALVPGVLALAVAGSVLFVGQGPDANESPAIAAGPVAATSTPTEVPIATFCDAFGRLQQSLTAFMIDGSASVAQLQTNATEVKGLAGGTVMPPHARAGVVYVLDILLGLDPTATPHDVEKGDDDSTIEDSANATAFAAWQQTACAARTG
jgi:hypothetical protein